MKKSTTTRSNEKATAAFAARVAEILALTEEIQNAAEAHFDCTPDEIHWGHVGDATWTRNELQNVLARIRGEGEYAKTEKE